MAETGASSAKDYFKTNLAEFEKAFLELKSELYMKRNEVNKLKSDLEESNHEIHTLKQTLEDLRKTLQENKITMDIFMKRTQHFEPKYYEKRDALEKLDLQHKIETSKNNALREDLQKIALEKSHLMRKVDVLEEKRKRDLMYSNEVASKLVLLKNVVAAIKSEMQTVKEEQNLINTLLKNVDIAKESAQKCQELSKIINNLKLETIAIEEECIKYKAKSEKLASFLSNNDPPIDGATLQAKVLLIQCKNTRAHYKQQIETKNDIISSLSDNLCQEKETNLKLLEDNENRRQEIETLNAIIQELRIKLDNGEATGGEALKEIQRNDFENIKLKNEPIEIEDSQ